jgi:hypothetical protein
MRTIRRFLSILIVGFVLLGGVAHASSTDSDGDGVPDSVDNCVSTYNPTQADWNNDGVGDACQDSDKDGLTDDYELITPYNNRFYGGTTTYSDPAKRDTDGDGWGDGYEVNSAKTDPTHRDSDKDGWEDPTEASVGTDPWNPDTDGDGVRDSGDNCAKTPNADQKDSDHDGQGDACDPPSPPPPPPQDPVTQAVQTAQQDAQQVQDDADALLGGVITDAEGTVTSIVKSLPQPDVRPAMQVSVMGSDGIAWKVVQSTTHLNLFTITAWSTPTTQVAFNLPDASGQVNGPVAAFLYDPMKPPAEGTRINTVWRYSAYFKTLYVSLSLVKGVSYKNVAVALAAPFANYSCVQNQLPTGGCTPTAMAFANPANGTVPVDAFDSVPAMINLQ